MASTTEPTVTPLVSRRFSLSNQISALLDAMSAVDAELIALGAGGYTDDDGRKLIVIAASEGKEGQPSFVLREEHVASAREISGGHFQTFFDRHVTFSPCNGFEIIVPKLLTPAAGRKLVEMCLVQGKAAVGKKAYVRVG